jgi:hypothetical protein
VRTAPLAVAALVALSACSGDDPAVLPAPTTVTASASATPPTTGAPTGAPAPPTSAPTPLPATPTAAPTRAAARDGDVDGDGRVDAVTATQDALTVRTATRTLTAAVVADDLPPVQGVTDVDRDGYAEVFLETTRGASTAFYTPFRFDGTTLAALTLDGEPVRLGVGGSVTHGDGFACRGGRLVVSRSTSDDGERFDVTTTTYAVRGHELVRGAVERVTGVGQAHPRVAASYGVDCGSVTRDG